MKALLCEAFGSPERLVLRDIPEPEPASDEVRISVRAAGVNFPDALIIADRYHVKAKPPFVPGSEVAGVIEAIGRQVKNWRVGDRVIAMTTMGAFAQQVTVSRDRLVALPEAIPFETGAALLMTHGTALHALRQRAAIQPGETLLVLGAAGGVGLAAVAIGKAMGAIVIAAASGAEKLALASQMGADRLMDYSQGDLRENLRDVAGAQGVDVVFDPVGGDRAEQAFRSIARGGRYLVVGFASGQIPSLPLNLPLLKSAAIVGVFWGAFVLANPAAHQANMQSLFAMMASGEVPMPPIARYPLEQGALAIRQLMERKALGKLVLSIPASNGQQSPRSF